MHDEMTKSTVKYIGVDVDA